MIAPHNYVAKYNLDTEFNRNIISTLDKKFRSVDTNGLFDKHLISQILAYEDKYVRCWHCNSMVGYINYRKYSFYDTYCNTCLCIIHMEDTPKWELLEKHIIYKTNYLLDKLIWSVIALNIFIYMCSIIPERERSTKSGVGLEVFENFACFALFATLGIYIDPNYSIKIKSQKYKDNFIKKVISING